MLVLRFKQASGVRIKRKMVNKPIGTMVSKFKLLWQIWKIIWLSTILIISFYGHNLILFSFLILFKNILFQGSSFNITGLSNNLTIYLGICLANILLLFLSFIIMDYSFILIRLKNSCSPFYYKRLLHIIPLLWILFLIIQVGLDKPFVFPNLPSISLIFR